MLAGRSSGGGAGQADETVREKARSGGELGRSGGSEEVTRHERGLFRIGPLSQERRTGSCNAFPDQVIKKDQYAFLMLGGVCQFGPSASSGGSNPSPCK